MRKRAVNRKQGRLHGRSKKKSCRLMEGISLMSRQLFIMTMESSPGVLSIAGFSGAAEIKNTTGPKMGKGP